MEVHWLGVCTGHPPLGHLLLTPLLYKTTACICRIHHSILRHRPTYLLSLCVLLTYKVGTVDSLNEAIPRTASQLIPLQ